MTKKNLNKLTEKEVDVMSYIYSYFEDNNYSPTRIEIARKFGWTKNGADYFVSQLEKKGKIKILPKIWRNIKLL